ncbi:MAG: hypothetical protein GY711_13625 [bacterium]|nr:hypothetical protein [bacterium]
MKLTNLIPLSAPLLALPATATADVHVEVTGVVTSATIPSGPFAGVSAGDAVSVSVDCTTPGTPNGASTVYLISTEFTIGAATIGQNPNTIDVVIVDNLPTLDGFCVFTGNLDSPGYQYQMLLRDTAGVMFTTANLEQLTGAYPTNTFTDVIWNVFAGGGQVAISTPLLVIDPPGPVPLGMSYCGPAVPNSSGTAARLEALGSFRVFDNQVELIASDLPAGQFGYFIVGQTQGFFQPPGSDGFICLNGNIGRYNNVADIIQGPTGNLIVDLNAIPVNPPQAVLPGETWNFQCWFRDNNPNLTSNFTDGRTIVFQ